MRSLYPVITPYQQGKLKVSELHTIYFEQVGNPQGCPAIFLHGGPGAGIEPVHRQYFNPQWWRVVLFDQRGCGQSTPPAELRENNTWELVADIERLREHLGIERWVVFGGSWGSTLALAYSETHPQRCSGLILRGIFTVRRQELQWFYQVGARYIFPDVWEHYLAPIVPPTEQHEFMLALQKRLTSSAPEVRLAAARALSVWVTTTIKLCPDQELLKKAAAPPVFAEALARIQNHYFVNHGFFDSDEQLLQNVDKIRHLPGVIVQGRYDMLCPMLTAWELHQAWPEAEFIVVPDAGHAISEPGIQTALLDATDRFAQEIGS